LQVGNVALERTVWRRPEDITQDPVAIDFVATSDSPADLAGQMVAAIAAGTLALDKARRLPQSEAESNLASAHRLYTSVMLAPESYQTVANISGSPLAQMYPSNSYLDDLFWAATWLLRATNEGFRPGNASYYYAAARTTFELAFAERDSMAVSADYVNNVALVHAATVTKDWAFHAAAQSWIWDWICSGEVRRLALGRLRMSGLLACVHSIHAVVTIASGVRRT
jgi:Glycosyl hydrolase family 9